jgi:molybdopterin-guanine dinucleotide biosynthesis protein A
MGGTNKALLDLGGKPVIERVASTLRRVFPEVVLITNTPELFEFLHLAAHKDLIPGHGSLGGLYTGLRVCSNNYAFLVACDMPFIQERVLRYMADLIKDQDVIVPKIQGMWEPLHAIYSRTCLPHIERLMDANDLKIMNFFDQVRIFEVAERDLAVFDPEHRFLINVNTPADLERARTMLR